MAKKNVVQAWLVGSLVLFWASFFFPALCTEFNVKLRGWESAWFCLRYPIDMLLMSKLNAWVIYFFAFNGSNLFMTIVPVVCLLARSWRLPSFLRIIQILLLIHVASWWVLFAIEDDLADIRIGYYVWLLAMIGALLGIQFRHRVKRNAGAEPSETGS